MFKRLQHIVRSYFTFTRGERRGILIVLILTGVVAIAPYIYGWMFPPNPKEWDVLINKLHHVIESTENVDDNTNYNVHYVYTKGTFQNFNPNTVPQDSLKLMGLPEKVAAHWTHYREKGGIFRYKDDVLKVYGVESKWFDEAKDYIRLPDKTDTNKLTKTPRPAKIKVIEFAAIELNSADTTLLMRLPGIGTKRSAAIVRYRDRLGGFYSKMQLREIHLVPDSVLEVIWNNITVNANAIKKFNINTTPMEDLQQHPYIGKKMGLIIDTHRHAIPIKDTTDLMTVPGMDEKRMHKLLPYLEF